MTWNSFSPFSHSTQGLFLFLPSSFSYIRECDRRIVDRDLADKPVLLYNYVSGFNCPNFLGARVQVNFDMNLDLIDQLCVGYWDWQLPLFLRFGFPMDFRGEYDILRNESFSHASADKHPEHVSMTKFNMALFMAPSKINPLGRKLIFPLL